MANWLYNGIELPELPEYDTTKYPYVIIRKDNVSNSPIYLHMVGSASEAPIVGSKNSVGVYVWYADGSHLVSYKLTENGEWEYIGEFTVVAPNISMGCSVDGPIWTNFDLYYGSDVDLAASAPIRVDSKLAISVRTAEDGVMLYNGVGLPNIDTVWTDELKKQYQYAAIISFTDAQAEAYPNSVTYNTRSLYVSDQPFYISTYSDSLYLASLEGKPRWNVKYGENDGGWVYYGESLADTQRVYDPAMSAYENCVLWSNHDIYKSDGTLYCAATSGGTGEPVAYLYNGVRMPPLPEAIGEGSKAFIWLGNLYYLQGDVSFASLDNEIFIGCTAYTIYEVSADGNVWVEREIVENGDVICSVRTISWANVSVINTATGEVYFQGSRPLPIYETTAMNGTTATFTCTNLNITDSVYKIAAWCYPKGTKWSDAPHTYMSAANFPGKNHSESWALPELSHGVEYELYACIMVDDVATDHNALITFTTDGVPELDFSNATLTVTDSTTSSTEFQFEMYYTGLPYNADGTSAMFHIVGVTDAGDEAIMGWRVTSGDGYVSGVFFDLEPLTDYTATFEVYYNGKPTGVTAEVSFTTREESDDDSGVDSGEDSDIIPKELDYNSWTWGYIVGSALRKMLASTSSNVPDTGVWAEVVDGVLYIHRAYDATQSGNILEVN